MNNLLASHISLNKNPGLLFSKCIFRGALYGNKNRKMWKTKNPMICSRISLVWSNFGVFWAFKPLNQVTLQYYKLSNCQWKCFTIWFSLVVVYKLGSNLKTKVWILGVKELIQGNTEPEAFIIISTTVFQKMCVRKHGLQSTISNLLLPICNRSLF